MSAILVTFPGMKAMSVLRQTLKYMQIKRAKAERALEAMKP